MNQTERIYKIEQILHERNVATFQQLQDAVEVSRATLKRDLQYLRDRLNAPIIYDREAPGGGGYRFETPDRYAPRHQLPGLWFNASEIHALLMMQNLLEEVQPGLLGPHIAPLQTRLASLLGSQDAPAEDVTRRIRILRSGKRAANLQYFELIASVLLKRQRLFIRHYNRGRDEETEREVSPQRLIYYRDNWYLDAWCHLRKEIRSFAVDAIRRAELVDRQAHEVPAAKLDAVLGAGYGIFAGAKVQWARLRFSPEHARWVASEQWHPQQKSSVDEQGRYLLEVPYAHPTELVMDILRHGAGVEVLGPPALRAAVQQELAAALAAY
mgnify:CR=1 FL=1